MLLKDIEGLNESKWGSKRSLRSKLDANGPLGGDDELPDSRVDVTEGLYWVLMYSRRSLRVSQMVSKGLNWMLRVSQRVLMGL